jgi:alpha-beta hydrolase superfamily lysophospholipase
MWTGLYLLLCLARCVLADVHVDELVPFGNDGCRLRVLTRGRSEDLPALVYTPFAWTFPAIHSGDHVFLPLSDDFLLVTYDPRGVGGSVGPPARSFEEYVDDVLTVAQYVRRRFGRDAVYAAGTSSGATLVAYAAHRSPHLFHHILLNGPSLNFTRQLETSFQGIRDVWGVPVPVARALPAAISGVLVMLRVPFHDCRVHWWCRIEFFTPLTFMFSPYYRWGASTFFQAARAFSELRSLPGIFTYDLTAIVDYRVPVTLLSGEHDHYMANVADVAAYARRVRAPRTRHVVLPNASHALHIEQNDRYCDVVRDMARAGSSAGQAEASLLAPTPIAGRCASPP